MALSPMILQIVAYLFEIQINEKPSRSSFKHLVYGLRAKFSMFKNVELLRNDLKVTFHKLKLSRAQVLELKFGKRSCLSCKDSGGELALILSYPGKRAPHAS